jgi:hypothetical protein
MAERVVPRERLLYASYSPSHVYQDGTDDGQPILTVLFQELTESGGVGYVIREYSRPGVRFSTASPRAAVTGAAR